MQQQLTACLEIRSPPQTQLQILVSTYTGPTYAANDLRYTKRVTLFLETSFKEATSYDDSLTTFMFSSILEGLTDLARTALPRATATSISADGEVGERLTVIAEQNASRSSVLFLGQFDHVLIFHQRTSGAP